MAVAPHRRHPNLRLELPDPTSNHSHPFFPLPSSSSASSSSSSSSVPFADLEKLSVLGHGNSGTVYKVKHKRTSAVYALKVVRGDSDAVLRRRSLREVDILRRASDSPHVVRLHGTFERPCGTVGILMEYMDIGTLDNVVKNYGPLGESDLANVARQVLHGLDYLHSNKIIHRDIKPSNLLVNSKMEVKIADFGVSKIMCRTLDACDSYVGTCAYMSPERFDPDSNGGSYDGYAGDVWGLGLTLLELYLGYFPFLNPGQTPDWASLVCAICIGEPPRLPESAGAEFRSFVECCLRKESSERWRVTQLLTHPFVTKDRSVDS